MTADDSGIIEIEVHVSDESAVSSLKSLKSQISGLSSKLRGLNPDAMTGTSALSKLGTGMSDLSNKVKTLSGHFDALSEKIGSGLATAAKRGLEGMVALGVGAAAIAKDVGQQIQSMRFQLSTFAGPGLTNGLISQARSFSDIVGLSAQTSSIRSLITSPLYKNQAQALYAADQNIAAAAGPNASSVLSSLTSMESRAEGTGKIAPRALYQLTSLGIPATTIEQLQHLPTNGGPQSAEQNLTTLGNIMRPSDLNALITKVGMSSQFASAPTRLRSQTLEGSLNNIKRVTEDAFVGGSNGTAGPIAQILKTVSGPLTTSITHLVNTIAPPLMKMVSGLVSVFAALLPVLQPIIAELGNGLAKAFMGLTPIFKDLQPLGNSLAKSLGQAIQALLPIFPVLAQALLQLSPVLPSFVSGLALAIRALATFARLALDIFNVFTKIPVVGGAFKSIVEAMGAVFAIFMLVKKIGEWATKFKKFFKLGGAGGDEPGGGGKPTVSDPCNCGTGGAGSCTEICDGSELNVAAAGAGLKVLDSGEGFSSSTSLPGQIARAIRQIATHPIGTVKSLPHAGKSIIDKLGSTGLGVAKTLGEFVAGSAVFKALKKFKDFFDGHGPGGLTKGEIERAGKILPIHSAFKDVEDAGKDVAHVFSGIGGLFGKTATSTKKSGIFGFLDPLASAVGAPGDIEKILKSIGGHPPSGAGAGAGGLAGIIREIIIGLATHPTPVGAGRPGSGSGQAVTSADVTGMGGMTLRGNLVNIEHSTGSAAEIEAAVRKALYKIAQEKGRRGAPSPAGKAANSSQFWFSNGWVA